MNDIEPILTSLPSGSSGPSAPPSFDKTKLLIPGAIILAGLLVSTSILYGRLSAGLPDQQAGQALVGGLAEREDIVEVRTDDAPFIGDKGAPVKVVEFGDYQCPFCERYFQNVKPSVISEYVDSGKVKFVWMDYAFLGQESQWSAQAARCAGEQDRFWQYHDYLYDHQGAENSGAFSIANLKKFAQALGLDTANFNSCLDSGKYASAVTRETQYGSSIGTPATFINGRLVVGAVPYANIKSIIDAELNK